MWQANQGRTIKHSRPEDIPTQVLKTDIDTPVELLYRIFTDKSAIRLERVIPHKTPQERRLQQLFQLQRNHTSISTWESLQQNNLGKIYRWNVPIAERLKSWIPPKKIMHWSDCYTTHHSRKILGMERPTLHQFCSLRKGVRHHKQGYTMEIAKTLRYTSQGVKLG